MKIENMLQRFGCISFLVKPPWYDWRRWYVNILLTVDILHFYITWEISEEFSGRNLNPMAFLVPYWNYIWQSRFVMLNILQIPKKLYLAEPFVQKSDDSKNCNFLNSKLCHEYISASFTNFSEHSCLWNHLQEHILSMS